MARERSRKGVSLKSEDNRRKPDAPAKASRPPTGAPASFLPAGVELIRGRMVIEYGHERQLVRKLQRVLDALQPRRPVGGAIAKSAEASPKSAAGQCLDVVNSTQIVKDAVGAGNFDLEGQLGDLYASADELLLFRERVYLDVKKEGCDIDRGDIPADAENTQREVRDAIWENAS